MQRGCTCGAGGEVPAEELHAPLLDLERRRGQDHTVAPAMTAAAMTESVRAALLDAQEVEIEKAAWKGMKCVFRGLIALLWVYLIDLMRRYVATHSVEELVFTICPLGACGGRGPSRPGLARAAAGAPSDLSGGPAWSRSPASPCPSPSRPPRASSLPAKAARPPCGAGSAAKPLHHAVAAFTPPCGAGAAVKALHHAQALVGPHCAAPSPAPSCSTVVRAAGRRRFRGRHDLQAMEKEAMPLVNKFKLDEAPARESILAACAGGALVLPDVFSFGWGNLHALAMETFLTQVTAGPEVVVTLAACAAQRALMAFLWFPILPFTLLFFLWRWLLVM
ncbi:uncharacterized protein LOC120645392 [Panicum virgatum]|uniref:uncharacterized protein LOC120645392 n=1 Tax=Panicum virgatum TaxID=38727 RepID=UPI0019D59AC3|nr:uncharacterized protein LOC120645392 [Panicum virgatum]